MTLNTHWVYIISTTFVQQFSAREKQQFKSGKQLHLPFHSVSPCPERAELGEVNPLFPSECLTKRNRILMSMSFFIKCHSSLKANCFIWCLTIGNSDLFQLAGKMVCQTYWDGMWFFNIESPWWGFKDYMGHMWMLGYMWALNLVPNRLWLPCVYALC